MVGIAVSALVLSFLSSFVNPRPLSEGEHSIEILEQTVFEAGDDLSSAKVSPIEIGAGVLAEGPIPFLDGHYAARIAEDSENLQKSESVSDYPTWFESTLLARRLLALSTTGVFSTVFPASENSPLSGSPIGLPDYIANCDDKFPDYDEANGEGNPSILGLRIGTTYRNIAAGSNLSISIDWWGENPDNRSPASLPRLTLVGYLEELPTPPSPPSSNSELELCFLSAHPDAKYWLPDSGGSIHDGFWARMVVQEGYWIGGFGDVARIGWLNITEWKGVREHGSVEGVGDGSGRGWGDVRLPGENKFEPFPFSYSTSLYVREGEVEADCDDYADEVDEGEW
ncbi:hypothetical protein FQN54_008816 [Arachnomyces sp. PD_36]|nr:hypothetical protein FQN54_008816 [Arachnomyces sp. PD_36]